MPLSPRQASRLAEQILENQGGDEAEAIPRGDGEGEGVAVPLPQRIGRCRIRRLLASGGMGVVYEAEQENPRRIVAVKVMSRAFAARGRAALRRFEYEAQILARLDHPGIAKIYEAGTWDDGTGGVPYFVMELIPDAHTIIEFANAHELSPRERLGLFAKVCDAVHHGHQKGIIHRDLKPSNILVRQPAGADSDQAATGEAPQPKVIDFGVARAADTDISITTMHTRPGDIIGTLQYMSPEQCDGDPLAIDVRSDVYALGVILYELLCGRLPYDLSNTPIPRATRIVQEQEPDRPSLIRRALKGNLEAITLKAIEKNPANRYQSAADLARDVRRHLAREPIDARRPGAWTRTIRFVGKHPGLASVGLGMAVFLLTLGATSVSIWYLTVRPHHIELTPDGREARLMSFGGHILHTWKSSEVGRISFAELVPRAEGAGPLAVLGFTNHHGNPSRGALCAFDAFGDRDNPVWERRITEEDLFPELEAIDIDIAGFGVSWAMTADIFSEVPGPEIVAGYSHAPTSAGAIAVYDMEGKVLYRIWHDGAPDKGYWMPDAGLLVTATLNSEVYWSERGYPDVGEPHPIVVFALRPRLGHIGQTWTSLSDDGETTTLAWYRCLLPPVASKLVTVWTVARPLPRYDAGRFVTFALNVDDKRGVAWVLDATGNEVPGTRTPSDHWRIDEPFPVEYFQLGDLPPITRTEPGN